MRVDGVDVAVEVQARSCASCSDLAGVAVDCRSYEWQGRVVDHPPADLIVAAVRAHVARAHVARGARRVVTAAQPRPGTTSVQRFPAGRQDADT